MTLKETNISQTVTAKIYSLSKVTLRSKWHMAHGLNADTKQHMSKEWTSTNNGHP